MTTSEQIPSNISDAEKTLGWALIIDDHPLFCDALEMTLRATDEFSEVLTATNIEAALQVLERDDLPALILLDLNLPDVKGFEGLVRIKRRAENSPVVIVSSMTENNVITGAIAAGASGFVPKHSGREIFKDALNEIANNRVYKPTGFVESENTERHTQIIERLSSLTNQQNRILELICDGKLNKQIAYDLTIAEGTVKAHVTAIMRKLGVQRRTQAVLVVQEARFFEALPNAE